MQTRSGIGKTEFFYYLDEEKNSFVLVRVQLKKDASTLESFAVMRFCIISGKKHEILRFEATRRESLNVHRFYSKNRAKEFIGESVTWEAVYKLEKEIKENWERFVFQYKQRKDL